MDPTLMNNSVTYALAGDLKSCKGTLRYLNYDM